ncbi:unnamed protein product [Phyllotreta striolata]|uniref:Methyltransferase type 11 domain-containing protein n=1 Tax=Phyllotreta striolata TaxID=444603 RepID=A0A9N9XSB0_PHYSR|nr:unnamed protein product [Phyllotreta striolata]
MSFKFPELWTESSNAAFALVKDHLDKCQHLIKWKQSESILEIGLGTGHNSLRTLFPLLPDDYKEFIGSDTSEEMVEFAKKHFNIPKSTVRKLDVCAGVPIEFEERFDHVFGFLVMHTVKTPREAFVNIKRMLKPGGSAFLTFFERSSAQKAFEKLKDSTKWSRYVHEESPFPYSYSENPREDFVKDIESVGFQQYELKPVNDTYEFGEEEFIDLHLAVNPAIPFIPKELQEEYKKDYINELYETPMFTVKTNNGRKTIVMNSKSLILYATK